MNCRTLIPTIVLLAGIGGCSYDTVLGGGGGGGGGGDHDFTYTASLNGGAWTASSFAATESADEQHIRVIGSQTRDSVLITVDLHLSGFVGTGPYALGDLRDGSYAVVTYAPLGQDSTASYLTTGAAIGAVSITTFNPHSGDTELTFHFSTAPSGTVPGGFPDSLSVTGGHFRGQIAQ